MWDMIRRRYIISICQSNIGKVSTKFVGYYMGSDIFELLSLNVCDISDLLFSFYLVYIGFIWLYRFLYLIYVLYVPSVFDCLMEFRYNLEQVFDDFIQTFVIHGSLTMFLCGILIVFSGAYRSIVSLFFSVSSSQASFI